MELRHDHWEHDIELLFGRLKRERLFPSKTERKDEDPYPQRLQDSPDPLSEEKIGYLLQNQLQGWKQTIAPLSESNAEARIELTKAGPVSQLSGCH